MKRSSIFLLVPLLLADAPSGFATDRPMIVHEWGTITTRHAPDGTPHGRLNKITQAEVLPAFVHNFEPAQTREEPGRALRKTPLTPGRPDVNLRLETPVIYFYPTKDARAVAPFSVAVKLRGGVINEFFPKAQAEVMVDHDRISSKQRAGVIKQWNGDILNNYVVGSLRWEGIQLTDSTILPQTSQNVWLAPRKVNSASVKLSTGEGEKYLFYRGVAHLDALFQTKFAGRELVLRAPKRLHWMSGPSMEIKNAWIADFTPSGEVAFAHKRDQVIEKAMPSAELWRTSRFERSAYSRENLTKLRASLKQALRTAGLFEDEAEAMLETWRESYFEHPGLRVFYTVPKEWIDYFLPLTVSVPHEMTRVLIGRIDLLDH